MMFTHDEILSAVRTAGESGQPFTCGAVRDCLGVKSGDREKMNQFHRRFRTFQKEAADEIEKVGKNAYRLKHPDRARPAIEAPVIAHVVEAEALEVAADELMEVEPEVAPEAPAEVSPGESAPAEAASPAPVQPPLAANASAPLEILPAATASEPPPLPSAPIESMEMPLRMIEIDFAVQDVAVPPKPAPARETLQPMFRSWLGRGQALSRRVAEFFGARS